MKKNEVIGCYNRGKHYVETCLEQIASLEQNNDKELRQVLRGTVMVEVSYKALENFVKVCGYVINGEDGADKLKCKLYDLKDKVKQLYDSADKHNLITIREISDSILREIGEVEEYAKDNESDGGDMPPVTKSTQPEIIPETGDDNEESEDDDDGDDGDNENDDQIKLPLALDTQKARDLFTAAYNQGWIEGSESIGYRWVGFGKIHKITKRTVSCKNKLAYLCYKIYYPYDPSWTDIDSFFREDRLDRDWSNIKNLVSDNERPTWMNTIDHLIRNSGY